MSIEGTDMHTYSKKAFTMVELIFVIVIIGILTAIAVPKFAATRDDATITKAITTVAAVRSALATERQKRILRGNFDPLTSLGGATGSDQTLFDYYDGNTTGTRILEYPIESCSSGDRGCWIKTDNTTYTYKMPHNSNDIVFALDVNKFRLTCTETGTTGPDCKMISK